MLSNRLVWHQKEIKWLVKLLVASLKEAEVLDRRYILWFVALPMLTWGAADVSFIDMSLSEMLFSYFGSIVPFLFRVYNYGILACLSLIVMFTVVFSGLIAATDGSGFARKINSWVIIRSMIGGALLVPTGAGNYAMIQKIIMAVASYGIIAANSLLMQMGDSLADSVFQSGDAIMLADELLTDNIFSLEKITDGYDDIVDLALKAVAVKAKTDLANIKAYDAPQESQIQIKEERSQGEGVALSYNYEGKRIGKLVISGENTNLLIPKLRIVMQSVLNAVSSIVSDLPDRKSTEVRQQLNTGGNLTGYIQQSFQDTFNIPTKLGKDSNRLEPNLQCQRNYCLDNTALYSLYQSYFRSIIKNRSTGYLKRCYGKDCKTIEQGGIASDEFPRNMSFKTIMSEVPKLIDAILSISVESQSGSQIEALTKAITDSTFPVSIEYDKADLSTMITMDKFENDGCQVSGESLKTNNCDLRFQKSLQYNVAKYLVDNYKKLSISGALINSNTSLKAGTEPSRVGTQGVKKNLTDLITKFEETKSNSDGILPQADTLWLGDKDRLNAAPREANKMISGVLSHIKEVLFPSKVKNPVSSLRDMGIGFITKGVQYIDDGIRGKDGIIATDDEIAKRMYGGTVGIVVPARIGNITVQSLGPLTPWTRGIIAGINGVSSVSVGSMAMQVEKEYYNLYKLEPVGAALSSVFIIWGAFIGVFLPLVPLMVIFFSFIGWVLLIVEAMLASPLIALGLAHPNSQQFLGASDQVLMMLLLVSLRPILIVIAIFFAGVISYAGIYFLNEGMVHLLSALGLDNAGTGADVAIFVASMLIYSYIAFMVIVQVFSMVGSLPDKISAWVGMGPLGGTSPLQQLLSLRGQFEGGIQQGAQGLTSTGATAKSTMSSLSKARMDPKEMLAKKGQDIHSLKSEDKDLLVSDGDDSENTKKMRKQILRNKVHDPDTRKFIEEKLIGNKLINSDMRRNLLNIATNNNRLYSSLFGPKGMKGLAGLGGAKAMMASIEMSDISQLRDSEQQDAQSRWQAQYRYDDKLKVTGVSYALNQLSRGNFVGTGVGLVFGAAGGVVSGVKRVFSKKDPSGDQG
ncbi:MAG: hypothetical protein VXW87_04885 [Pseudomonadota bacterium]|nr:hypothetical protein [Pseudomonadota bacterium]